MPGENYDRASSAQPQEVTPTGPSDHFTKAELRTYVAGRSMEQIQERFGPPDAVWEIYDHLGWHYFDLAYDVNAQRLTSATIEFSYKTQRAAGASF